MHSRHDLMSFQEFQRLPRHPGWKYEYYEGMSHVSPRPRFAEVQVTLASRACPSPLPLRAVAEGDELPLVSAYVTAFADTVEYCDVPEEVIARSAGESIRAFLGGDRDPALPSSCVATYSGTAGPGVGAVAGAALVTRARNGDPLLGMLFVTPAWQRRGLATALVSWSLQELLARGERVLRSRYHLANEASRVWHRRFGFTQEQDPDLHDARRC